MDAVGLVEETREGETGCGLDPDEESGGADGNGWTGRLGSRVAPIFISDEFRLGDITSLRS